jgi:hypothetical protein
MTGLRDHAFGCTCRRHKVGAWDRSEHWSRADVTYLEASFGRVRDETIAKKLGRTVVGMRLKAKRLGLRKKDAGHTARDVARIFGVDPTTVVDRWVAMRVLPMRRAPWTQGPKPAYLASDRDLERFIRTHPEQIDVAKMPDSTWRDLAAKDPWISLAEAHRLTGRNNHAIATAIRYGVIRGRRRGLRGLAHWYIPASEVAKIPPLRTAEAIDESWFRRQSVLDIRRRRRKGLLTARSAA